jgi:hypothetical protein
VPPVSELHFLEVFIITDEFEMNVIGVCKRELIIVNLQLQVLGNVPLSLLSDGHMTPEEVERHLESRQTYLELVPEKAPPTVPTEMFSNDPSLDRYVFC